MPHIKIHRFFAGFFLAACCLGFALKPEPALKEAFRQDFFVGAALNAQQVSGRDIAGQELVKKHFNSISPENQLKWTHVHPRSNQYSFQAADAFVAFGQQQHLQVIGHTLVWHQQTPNWVFEDEKGRPVSRQVLVQRMHDHITTVVGRFAYRAANQRKAIGLS